MALSKEEGIREIERGLRSSNSSKTVDDILKEIADLGLRFEREKTKNG